MNYSIIVPTCNRQSDLERLIDSILKQTVLPTEIIIIDQSDNNDTKNYIETCRQRLLTLSSTIDFIYIYQAEKSSAAARNKGIDIAQGDVVSFLDDDVVLFEDYYEKVFHCFRKNNNIGGVSGKVMGKNSHSWGMKLFLKFFLLDNFDGKITTSGFGFPMSERQFESPMSVEMFIGCNMNFLRRFLKSDKFDEWFTGYSYREDVEYSYRVSKKTGLILIPEAKLYHNNSRSNRMDIQSQKMMEVRNYYYFYKKHIKKTMISDYFFLYSLFGFFLVYFKEYLWNSNIEKYRQLKGFTEGIFKLLKYKTTILKK